MAKLVAFANPVLFEMLKKAFILLIIGCSFALCEWISSAQELAPVESGGWPGYHYNGAVVSKLVFRDSLVWATMSAGGVQVFEISNPAEPLRLGGIGAGDGYQ